LTQLMCVRYYVHMSNIKNTLSISEFRKNLFKITDRARKPGNYYTLTDKGRPAAVLMSAEEFESWQETLEVMQDFPDLGKRIAEVDRDVKSGAYLNYPTFEDILMEMGYVNRDGRIKPKHAISSRLAPKRKKRSAKRS